ncbi:MAG TPA: tetratricopeptide repeat protein [Bdellovibrionales bacterium]|nr:tetratricopeptide repeat protein [Bdellovibrionales bacterium]
MGKQLVICLLAGLFLSCASGNKEREKAELHLRIGTAHLNQGNYPLALRELLEAHRLDSSNPIICNNLALAYYVRGRHAEAEKYLNQAIKLDPKYTDAYNNLGRVHIDTGRYDLAITELTRVVNDLTYPQPEKGLSNLGLAHLKAKNYQEAQRRFKEALQANSAFCPAHNHYAQALYHLKDYKKAAAATETALQLCPNLDEAHYYGALSYLKMGQRDRANARMREIVELYPTSEFAKLARSHLNQASNDGTESP